METGKHNLDSQHLDSNQAPPESQCLQAGANLQAMTSLLLMNKMRNFPIVFRSQNHNSESTRSTKSNNQFSLPGSTKVLAMILAMILGGIAMRIFKPSARAICLWAVAFDIINIAVVISAIYLPCDNWKLGGTSYLADGRSVHPRFLTEESVEFSEMRSPHRFSRSMNGCIRTNSSRSRP